MRISPYRLAALVGWASVLVPFGAAEAQAPPPAYTGGGPSANAAPIPTHPVRLDLDVGVPLFLNTGRLDPGVSAAATVGYDFGFVVPVVRFGYMWSPLNTDFPTSTDLMKLSASLGVRFETGGRGPILIYVTPMVDLDIWHPTGTLQVPNCGAFYCSLSGDDWQPSPGVSLQLGADIRPFGAERFGLGFGILGSMTFAPAPLPNPSAWVEPYLRVTALF
jgi:hypothetical protein